ncbi:MAG TPA: hypothetical protein VFY14_07845 [Streptomyces sp.]|nr:hypothetical protein [Streptomyces sp.]
MARTRTTRLVAAVASLPLAVAVLGGVAHAHDGRNFIANDDSIASLVAAAAIGENATAQANSANVNNSAFTSVDQSNRSINVVFDELW